MNVFWAKGYAGTSTEDLLEAMGIGRQSLYNAFVDKRHVYLEALALYQQRTTAEHLRCLDEPISPLKGITALLDGVVSADSALRRMGCMGVNSVGEFGMDDAELSALRAKTGAKLRARLAERLCEGQKMGEVDLALDAREAASFIQLTMSGLQLAARGGASANEIRRISRFAADRLAVRIWRETPA